MAVSGVSVDVQVAGVVVVSSLLVHAGELRLAEMHVLVEAGGHRVQHQRADRRHHRHEPREGELPPWTVVEARRCEGGERLGKDVDESGGEYHPGGERLYHEEHVVLRPQELESPAQNREADANAAGAQN